MFYQRFSNDMLGREPLGTNNGRHWRYLLVINSI
jgi:hypothetical protein